jgi:virginiamycin A acetyltransferase
MYPFRKKKSSAVKNQNENTITGDVKLGRDCLVKQSILNGNITVGERCRINQAAIYGKVSLGRYASLWGPNIDIYSLHHLVSVGSFTSIARNTSIQEYNHIIDRCSTYFMFQNVFNKENGIMLDTESNGEIKIGNDVWIGAQCVIVSGAVIGDGCVIGANSVVTGIIPPYSIAVGSPAKVIKQRFDQPIIDKLMEINWWNWDIEKIKRNEFLFRDKLTLEKLEQITD